MFLEIKNRIEQELKTYLRSVGQAYGLSKISPSLFKHIRDFISRKGKRIRPCLFVMGYLGFADKAPPGLYRSALSLELLHDFMLVHDDIIDKSDTRRGRPSMHAMLNHSLKKYKNIKFNGQDLTIVIGDVMFAMALDAFLSVKENMLRKEMALRKLIAAAFYTGSGEFIELLAGTKDIAKISRRQIYKIYGLKTANYTFASPLAIGATLAGAKETQVRRLFSYGLSLGRAFQIKDDLLGCFAEESETGKSNLTDLQEAKKTILIWHAYHHCAPAEKTAMRNILSKNKVNPKDLRKIRGIIIEAGSLSYAWQEINLLRKRAKKILNSSSMHTEYKKGLSEYAAQLL